MDFGLFGLDVLGGFDKSMDPLDSGFQDILNMSMEENGIELGECVIEQSDDSENNKGVSKQFTHRSRYIPRERFLDPRPPPSYQFCTWILQKVSKLDLTRGRIARPPSLS